MNQKRRVIRTLKSQAFKRHITKTLMGMPPRIYEPFINKLISHARRGEAEKWCGVLIFPVEFRIGYEANGNCYTQVIREGEVDCYDFGLETRI